MFVKNYTTSPALRQVKFLLRHGLTLTPTVINQMRTIITTELLESWTYVSLPEQRISWIHADSVLNKRKEQSKDTRCEPRIHHGELTYQSLSKSPQISLNCCSYLFTNSPSLKISSHTLRSLSKSSTSWSFARLFLIVIN